MDWSGLEGSAGGTKQRNVTKAWQTRVREREKKRKIREHKLMKRNVTKA